MKCITELKDIKEILEQFKNDLPSLMEGKVNIDTFSQKLHQFGRMCVYEDLGVTKGFAAYYANDEVKNIAYLSMIAVKRLYRREHIGTQLLCFVEKKSCLAGMKFLRLEVNKLNDSAIRFYKRHQYSITEETTESYYMTKELFREG